MLRTVAWLAVAFSLSACSGTGLDEPIEAEGQAQTAACAAAFRCTSTSEPALGPKRGFDHLRSVPIAIAALANHRGRDAIVVAGQEQWIIGKFSYGLADKDLKDEEVDIFVDRGCRGGWQRLATVKTTKEDAPDTAEGVENDGGRVFFRIPKEQELPVGRHRVRLVVAGDHTFADLFIDVIEKETPVFVSDVDGTLTSSENVEFRKLLVGKLPDPQPDAVSVLSGLAAKGYRPVYITARPEWLTQRTHAFLAKHGFPPGIVQTTTSVVGFRNEDAARFKAKELARLRGRSLDIRWAFGNKESDTVAYERAGLFRDARCIFLRVNSPKGGRRIEGYAELLPDVAQEPSHCGL
jgi:phosphatidate phosphatase PAH1